MNLAKIFLLCIAMIAMILPVVIASCSNKCSGHGSCTADDVCVCQQNWLAGDCSERQCPFTRAWSDVAMYNNDAHYYAECGNRGTCDRTTGNCICDTGFTGSGCRRMECPNKCSGHGTCEYIEELTTDADDKRIGGSSSTTYVAWDQEKIMGCKCDPGYEGHNCARRMCPYGDDPLTSTTQYEMAQIITFTAVKDFFLTYYDPYGNAFTTSKITGSVSHDNAANDDTVCTAVQVALRKLPSRALDQVTVTAVDDSAGFTFARTDGSNVNSVGAGASTATSATDNKCAIAFPAGPGTSGLQYLIGCNVAPVAAVGDAKGYQPLVFATGTNACTTAEYVASTATVRMLTESVECSGRGTCDSGSGKCKCFMGHRGIACEVQETLC